MVGQECRKLHHRPSTEEKKRPFTIDSMPKQMNSGALKKAKTLKKTKTGAEEEEVEEKMCTDRLSTLPKDLIHHILSFLDTKFAAQTCLLSKRWRSLWTSLPNLAFYSSNYRKLAFFDKFVSRVLGLCWKSDVRDFHFDRPGSTRAALLKKLVNYAISHKVERLSIDIYFSPKLTSLYLKGFPPNRLCARSLLSLEKVELDIFRPGDIFNKWRSEDEKCVVSALTNVFLELDNAKSVTLGSYAIEILSMFPGLPKHQPSPFSNLKYLKLKLQRSTNSTVPYDVMAFLLNCSPGVDVVREFSD
ncbi:hypothetical protein Acr_22g0007150 [Actinidia rufa]|uniref:F-box domain-containing protein n=1 Tax=Actinidia rufa TaxID=165716 RepID=A0A7J0GKH2_9ERIC|nr:hypothetical protein Acr_22g0007150 [Actinidia rufa]